MAAAVPFAAHAETSYHSGTDIIGGTSTAAEDLTAAANTALTDYGHNEFTEYNDPSTTNTRVQTFGTPAINNGAVDWTTTPSTLGNVRTSTGDMQDEYPIVVKNEAQRTRYGTLAQNLASDDFLANDNDSLGGEDGENTATTDLETVIPVFDMTIPAKTVLPIGATTWKLGQVEMNGKYFVNPDRIGLIITKTDFVRMGAASPTTADTIIYDIKSAASSGTSYVTVLDEDGNIPARDDATNNLAILDFHQNGTKSDAFPWTYSSYTTDDYDAGKVVEINEAKDLWLTSSDWADKNPGRYHAGITFTAYIVNGSFMENGDLKTAPYPKKADASEFWADAT